MEESSETKFSASAGDAEAGSAHGPEVGAEVEREMILDSEARGEPDAFRRGLVGSTHAPPDR